MQKQNLHIILILLLLPLALSSCLEKKFNPGILNDQSISIESHPTYDKDSLYLDINIINNEDFDIVYPALDIYYWGLSFIGVSHLHIMKGAYCIRLETCGVEPSASFDAYPDFYKLPYFYNLSPSDTLSFKMIVPRKHTFYNEVSKGNVTNNILDSGDCKRFELSLYFMSTIRLKKIFPNIDINKKRYIRSNKIKEIPNVKRQYMFETTEFSVKESYRHFLAEASTRFDHEFFVWFEY